METDVETSQSALGDDKLVPIHQSFAYAVYKISSSFVSLEGTNTVINQALKALGEVCDAGRAYVFLFDPDAGTMDNTHEWCAPGVKPEIEMLTDLPVTMFPWWMQHLHDGEMIMIPEVSELPPEAHAEREILEAQDVLSVLVLPIYRENALAGFIGLDNVHSAGTWQAESREYLLVASDMVSSTITREQRIQDAAVRTQELEAAYENLKRTQSRLVHAEKLASIGMLAAGVAHEINNPVGFLKSNTETLRDYFETVASLLDLVRTTPDRGGLEEQFRAADLDLILPDIDDILSSNLEGLQRITTIVRSLMNFSRGDGGDGGEMFDYADLNEGIRGALTVATNALKYVVDVDFVPGEIPAVRCNVGSLNQVFLNIVFNAAQAFAELEGDRRGTLTIRTTQEGEFVRCEFRDDGPGIPDEVIPRIFEPFFTTKKVGKGTGLGMSIAYDIVVNKHNGELTAGNNPEGGACFTVRIPVGR